MDILCDILNIVDEMYYESDKTLFKRCRKRMEWVMMAKNPTDGVSSGLVRSKKMSLRLTESDDDRITYYAERFGMTKTELVLASVEHYIKWVNSDYDLPTAEIQRLNQLVDAINRLSVNQQNTEKTVINGFNAMLGFVRGDNYLSDAEEGEL